MAALEDARRAELLTSLAAARRPSPAVEIRATATLSRYVKAGAIMRPEEARDLREAVRRLKGLVGKGEGDRLAIRFVSAAASGGGAAETRPDSVALLRDLRCDAEWLVGDGCGLSDAAAARLREGLRSPDHRPLTQADVEVLHLVAIHNFARLRPFVAGADAVWVDGPGPLGLIPLIRAVFPGALVQWRGPGRVDPEPSVRAYVADLLEGRLDEARDALLLRFLRWAGAPRAPGPAALRAHAAVLRRDACGAALALRAVPVRVLGPAVDPLSFRNVPVNKGLVRATLAKYGVIANVTHPVPPLVTAAARYAPCAGPLEAVTSFIEGLKGCRDVETRAYVVGRHAVEWPYPPLPSPLPRPKRENLVGPF